MKPKPLLLANEGFTLIELMIAVVIISIGLLALAGLQISTIKGNSFAQRMTAAISIAEQRLEQIRNTTYANIQSEPAAEVQAYGLNFVRQVTIANNSPLSNVKTVRVDVTWLDGSKTYIVPLTTIIAQ